MNKDILRTVILASRNNNTISQIITDCLTDACQDTTSALGYELGKVWLGVMQANIRQKLHEAALKEASFNLQLVGGKKFALLIEGRIAVSFVDCSKPKKRSSISPTLREEIKQFGQDIVFLELVYRVNAGRISQIGLVSRAEDQSVEWALEFWDLGVKPLQLNIFEPEPNDVIPIKLKPKIAYGTKTG